MENSAGNIVFHRGQFSDSFFQTIKNTFKRLKIHHQLPLTSFTLREMENRFSSTDQHADARDQYSISSYAK